MDFISEGYFVPGSGFDIQTSSLWKIIDKDANRALLYLQMITRGNVYLENSVSSWNVNYSKRFVIKNMHLYTRA